MGRYARRRKVLLHIGWPKTGTTTLQKHALNKIEGFRYLGKVPYIYEKNIYFFQLVNLVSYASEEKFATMQVQMFDATLALEKELFGDIDESATLILSEESFLSSLLKPSDHQHHGYSTASLSKIIARLADLQELWNISFDFLITEREPFELLHAYYAQAYHLLLKFRGLETFQRYINVGVEDLPGTDLGFRYLRPGVVLGAFQEAFGPEHVFTISMDRLFSPGWIHLSRWYPGMPDLPTRTSEQENKRTIAENVKVAHLRPFWVPKRPFELRAFMRDVRTMFMTRHADHPKIEVTIRAYAEDRKRLTGFLAMHSEYDQTG